MTDSKMASIDLDEKINRMRLKNEEIKRRYEEVEADKKRAAKANALVNLVPSKDWPIRKEPPEYHEPVDASLKQPLFRETVRPQYPSVQERLQRNSKYGQVDGPPPDPKYNFLADTERETQLTNYENKIDEDKNAINIKAQRGGPRRREGGPSASTRSGGSSQSHFKDSRTSNVFHSREDRPDYEAWRAERNKIDEARINRQKTAEGNWRREWDVDKSHVDKEFTKKGDYNRNNSNNYERKNNHYDGDHSHKGYGGTRVFHGSQRSSEHQDYNRRSQPNSEFRRTTSDKKDTKNEWSNYTHTASHDTIQGTQSKGSLMSVKVNAPSIAGTGRVGPRQKSRVTYSSQQDSDAGFEANSYSKPKSFDYRNEREFGNANKIELKSTEFTSSLKSTSTSISSQKVETDQKEFRKHTYSQQRPRPMRNLSSEKMDHFDRSENTIFSNKKDQLKVTQNVNEEWEVEINQKSSEKIEMPVGLIISNSNLKQEETTPLLDLATISKTMIFENNSVPSMNSTEIVGKNANINADENVELEKLVTNNENSIDNFKNMGTFVDESVKIAENAGILELKPADFSEIVRYHKDTFETIETVAVKSDQIADSVQPNEDESIKIACTVETDVLEPTKMSAFTEPLEDKSINIAGPIETFEVESTKTSETIDVKSNEIAETAETFEVKSNEISETAETFEGKSNEIAETAETFEVKSNEIAETIEVKSNEIAETFEDEFVDTADTVVTFENESEELSQNNVQNMDNVLKHQELDTICVSSRDIDQLENDSMQHNKLSNENSEEKVMISENIEEDNMKVNVNLLLIDDDGALETPMIPRDSEIIETINSKDSRVDDQNLDAPETSKVTEENALISQENDSHPHNIDDMDNEEIKTEDLDCEDQSFVDADEDFVDAIDQTYDFESVNTDVFDSPLKTFYDADSTSQKMNTTDEFESSNNQTFDEPSSEFKETIEVTKEPNDKIDTVCDNSSATINEPPTTALKDILEIICDEKTISDLDNTFNEIQNLELNLNNKNAVTVELQTEKLVEVSENIASSMVEEKNVLIDAEKEVFLNETQEIPLMKLEENVVSVEDENNVATSTVSTKNEDNSALIEADDNITMLEVKESVSVESKEEFFIETKDDIAPIEAEENMPSMKVEKKVASLALNENVNVKIENDVLSNQNQEKVLIEMEKDCSIENKDIPVEAEISSIEIENNDSIEKIEGN